MSPKLCHLYARTDALFDRHCYFESMDRDSERVTYLSDEVGILRERICNVMALMAIRVVEFSSGGTKVERFLHENQHTERKLLNILFCINGELSKRGRQFKD